MAGWRPRWTTPGSRRTGSTTAPGAGPDADKAWLLGADDRLTEIRDEHVAEMTQADFDELVEGTGPLRRRAGDAYDPQAAVERHRAWTAAIRAQMG